MAQAAKKKSKPRPKPKPYKGELVSDVVSVVKWLRKNCKQGDGMAVARVSGLKAGIKVYPLAWGKAWAKKSKLRPVTPKSRGLWERSKVPAPARRKKVAARPPKGTTHRSITSSPCVTNVVIHHTGGTSNVMYPAGIDVVFEGDTLSINARQ